MKVKEGNRRPFIGLLTSDRSNDCPANSSAIFLFKAQVLSPPKNSRERGDRIDRSEM